MKLKTILPPVFLAVCLAAAAVVVGTRPSLTKTPMQAFTLYIVQTSYPSSGGPIQTAIKVRHHKSDGSWKMETTYSSGKKEIAYGEPGRGVFALDDKNQRLEYLSPSSSGGLADIDWTKQPGFAGEETILGYKTYRIHWESNGDYTDSYICPALQGFPLRRIAGNARTRTVWETTQIIPAEPDFEPPPNLPVSTRRFEEKSKP